MIDMGNQSSFRSTFFLLNLTGPDFTDSKNRKQILLSTLSEKSNEKLQMGSTILFYMLYAAVTHIPETPTSTTVQSFHSQKELAHGTEDVTTQICRIIKFLNKPLFEVADRLFGISF